MKSRARHWRLTGCLLGGLLLTACSTVPTSAPPSAEAPLIIPVPAQTLGDQIAQRALALQGRPYLFGGNGPEAFDCSGLVRFVHNAFGIETPRTTLEQFRVARRVELEQIKSGDLLFFRIDAQQVSHVAIYAGDGRFVHAPQTGRAVETRAFTDPFYRSRLVGAGRLYDAGL